ncbi:hypothetical protein J22TS1_13900 [Siminovitchia terrae]|nr:hypothetical protein J22TS1_13900 [Siminovitchia terrae]
MPGFNFIQQKSPTSVSGEMNANWYFIQRKFKPRLNKVKASGGCHRFSEEIDRAELDKIWAQIRQGTFDKEEVKMKEISAKEVEQKLDQGEKLNIIDVREADEVAAGKIPEAIHIPLGLVELKISELDKSKEYIMVCRSGGRSGRATQFLESHGYKAMNMVGGMLDWEGKIK